MEIQEGTIIMGWESGRDAEFAQSPEEQKDSAWAERAGVSRRRNSDKAPKRKNVGPCAWSGNLMKKTLILPINHLILFCLLRITLCSCNFLRDWDVGVRSEG